MNWFRVIAGLAGLLACAQCGRMDPAVGSRDEAVPTFGYGSSRGGRDSLRTVQTSGGRAGLLREIDLRRDMVPAGTHGRKVVRRMNPRYITIHSTQNYTADAARHALALKRGALRAPKNPNGGNRIGYLIWHFTTDDEEAVQHMPTSEQGEHADFGGPGNRYSIGIEMCEQRGADRDETVDRTAKLAAYLMDKHGIPLSNVVPHYHWERKGTRRPHKNCPHFLMTNGRPGRKWAAFKNRVDGYYDELRASQMVSR